MRRRATPIDEPQPWFYGKRKSYCKKDSRGQKPPSPTRQQRVASNGAPCWRGGLVVVAELIALRDLVPIAPIAEQTATPAPIRVAIVPAAVEVTAVISALRVVALGAGL